MAITFIGAAAGDGTSITVPGVHQAGDVVIIFAFRSATTAPTLPTGWTQIGSSSSGASSLRVGYRLAQNSATPSGTWTNATGLICAVYRGTATNKSPVNSNGMNSGSGTGTTITYNATMTGRMDNPGTSWMVAFAATKTTDSSLETPPADMVNIVSVVGAAVEYAAFDSNGPIASWASRNTSVGGTSAEWRAGAIEIRAEQLNMNNYMGFDVGDGMSTTEKIR